MYAHPGIRPTSHRVLAENTRTATKARIKRASKAARGDVTRLVDRSLEQLERHYRAAADDLAAVINASADLDGNVKIEALDSILTGTRQQIAQIAEQRDLDLGAAITKSASLGVEPFRDVAELTADLASVANEAARFVQEFVAEDGLNLSDRLWRIDSGAYRSIEDQLQNAIIRGDGASKAAQDFLRRGVPVPDDVRSQLGLARADSLARVPGGVFLRDDSSAYAKALRVFRTEINRAHGEAYQGAAFEHPDVIGTRFLLSPNHPRADICDMHASVNRYGLGRGVYPKGRNPWPAHPNTLSFVEVVFSDEVSDDDRQGKEDRIAWLKRRPPADQAAILGAQQKQAALNLDLLREGDIATPWNVLERKLLRRGVDVKQLKPTPSSPPRPKPAPPAPTRPTAPSTLEADGAPRRVSDFFRSWTDAGTFGSDFINRVLERFHAPDEIPHRGGGAYYIRGAIHMAGKRPADPRARGTMRHETGHHIDDMIGKWKRRTGSNDVGLMWSSGDKGTRAMELDNTHIDQLQKEYFKGARDRHEDLRGRRFSQAALNQARRLDQGRFLEENGNDVGQAAAAATRRLEKAKDLFGAMYRTAGVRRGREIEVGAAHRYGDTTLIANMPVAEHVDLAHMADLMGGLTRNRIGWGHSDRYYRERRGWGQQAEAFANVFDLLDYGPGFERDYMEALAPNFLKFVEDSLQEVIDAES